MKLNGRNRRARHYALLTLAIMNWMAMPVWAADSPAGGETSAATRDINVEAERAKEAAKYESQSTTIITKEDIAAKQAKNLEDIIFSETGVTRTVDAMGRVGISIRGADPRHTLMLIDGQPVMGSESKYMGGSDEAMRIGTENIERIEIIRGAATAKYGPDAIGGVINIITKTPANTPSFEFNGEARYHNHEDTDENNTWPSNFYLRADSGKVGNAKFSIFGSKRDIMPVYSSERGYKKGETWYFENFKPSLRYYGDIKTIGGTGEIDLDKNNKISFRIMQEKEDMERRNKSESGLGALFEPMQIFTRDMERSTYNFTYTGKDTTNDWKIDVSYGKMKENDTTKTTYYGSGHDKYGGKNTLASVDWLEHKQLDINATMNTQVDDKHLLSYGIGYTDERADGTRLKQAPKTWVKSIDPWAYDQSLWVPAGSTEPDSNVHNYLFKQTSDGLIWDRNLEYYGTSDLPAGWMSKSEVENAVKKINTGDTEALAALTTFANLLSAKNTDSLMQMLPLVKAQQYYGLRNGYDSHDITYNGKYYMEEFNERTNQVSGGEARIQRRHAFFGDTWQVDDDTIITPVVRVDNSDLFDNHITANIGVTHNINGNPHRRFKFNAGTGYAEPGMGELYYNWEMYGSAGGSRYGWYWIGNPNLKPEKSVNFDVSVEGEQGKTYAKATLFNNTISDYMTSYFTGQLVDFNQFGSSYVTNADRIYSFKNIGKAQITGIEAEVQQRFDNHWSTKLGYAWLHAINKSDPDMPRQLLDRPQHKVDISLNYQDAKTGWKAALWGDYYINMLDSNSISNIYTKSDIDSNGNWIKKSANYNKKTFGIWNFMVEKQITPEAKVYFGIDNLFNHRDDDRAYQDRTYRIGANFKLGGSSHRAANKVKAENVANTAADGTGIAGNGTLTPADTASGYDVVTTASGTVNIENNSDWFLAKPSDKDKGREAGDAKLIGDYRIRSNMYGGKDLATTTRSTTTELDDGAEKNMRDPSDHGLEQRLRIGGDFQLAKNTNLVVLGSTGDSIDTKYTKSNYRGLRDVRLDTVVLNQKLGNWDISAGRLTERMGVTGYWFGNAYDGLRATWTDANAQVRMGYGDFSKSTGIYSSAYTHTEKAIIKRSPTLAELLGVYPGVVSGIGGTTTKYPDGSDGSTLASTSAVNYLQKWIDAGADTTKSSLEIANARLAILQELNTELLKVAAAYTDDAGNYYGGNWYTKYFMTMTDPNQRLAEYPVTNGSTNEETDPKWDWTGTNPASTSASPRFTIYTATSSGTIKKSTVYAIKLSNINNKSWGEMLDTANGKSNIYDYLDSVYESITAKYGTITDSSGTALNKTEVLDAFFVDFVGSNNKLFSFSGKGLQYFTYLVRANFDPFNGSEVPISVLDSSITVEGTLLKQDVIPSIDRAAYIQFNQKVGKDLGLTAWYLRSSGDKFRKTGYNEDMSTYEQRMDVANVFGLGAQYRLGSSRLSFDWGVNRSETGRYFDGGRDEYGRYTGGGSNPTFWVLRADIGHADTNVPGSWSAFADYKYFRHGSFFGGNGTESLPDRYLDGIRSFTIGAGYVPTRNLLLEAFYTFGAKSTQRRDTLHGSENFSLGDYARIQATYKF